jgi:ABC-type molybdenum transport system ATPase subunit/photorepair protein PhrA
MCSNLQFVLQPTNLQSASPKMTPLIELKGVSKAFGGNIILDQVDLTIDRGEALAIIGPSGTGNQRSYASLQVYCWLMLVKFISKDKSGSV